jgi:regulator of replication initiation timing
MTELEKLKKENAELRAENERLKKEVFDLKWRLSAPMYIRTYVPDEPVYTEDYDDRYER